MGAGFTLLRFDAAVDVTALELVARLRNTPLKILDVEQPYHAVSMAAHWFYRGRTNMGPGAAITCRPIRWR